MEDKTINMNEEFDENLETNDVDSSEEQDVAELKAQFEVLMEEMEKAKAELKAKEEARKKAEDAAIKAKRELKRKESEGQTEEERLRAEREEFFQEQKQWRVDANREIARGKMLAFGISDDELDDDTLSLFVDEDRENTTSRIEWLAKFVKTREEKADARAVERELKKMPQPPAGEQPDAAKDDFLVGFNDTY